MGGRISIEPGFHRVSFCLNRDTVPLALLLVDLDPFLPGAQNFVFCLSPKRQAQ